MYLMIVGGCLGLMQFVDERVYVDCVEGLTELQGHDYSAIWWLGFVKALCDLVCELV